MLYRLRTEFQLSVIVLFALAATFGVLPLGAYRLLTGGVFAGLADLGMVAFACGAAAYAWRTGDTRRTGLALVIVNMLAGIAMAHRIGPPALFAMDTLLVASFLLIDRWKAAVIAALTLIVLVVDGAAFASQAQMLAFVVNASMISVFAFIFASSAEAQRRQLRTLATLDFLTGLHNRRAMEQELRIAVETHKRSGVGFGLVMLDLDHFKRVNDEHGHESGDRILATFAELLRNSSRKVDRAFRYGGEEFVMLFPGVDLAGLRTVTTNLHARIAANLHGPGGPVTTSLGAALLMPGEDEHTWLARVDAALYQAKANGRDRVVIDEGRACEAPACTES